ncbi:hypothetical protein Q5752_006183 [Cryptotrichosporon argae]
MFVAPTLRRALARPSAPVRHLHASAPSMRKPKPVADAVGADSDLDLEADDLFSSADSAPSSSGSRADRRASLARSILSAARLPTAPRRAAAAHARVGELRKVVQLTQAGEADELRAVIKAWRVSGRRVTVKTAEEIVGRCVNLGRPDLAKELAGDTLQYGLPVLPERTAAKLAAA